MPTALQLIKDKRAAYRQPVKPLPNFRANPSFPWNAAQSIYLNNDPHNVTLVDSSTAHNMSGTHAPTSTSGRVLRDGRGYYLHYTGASGHYSSLGTVDPNYIQNTMQFAIAYRWRAGSVNSRLSPMGNAASADHKGFWLTREYGAGVGTNALRFNAVRGVTASPVWAGRTADNVLTDLKWHSIVVQGRSNTDVEFWIDGQISPIGTTEASGGALPTGASTRACVFVALNHSTGVIANSAQDFGPIMFFNRSLRPNEIRALHDNPYWAYSGAPKRLYPALAAAPGGFQPAWAARSTVTLGAGVAA